MLICSTTDKCSNTEWAQKYVHRDIYLFVIRSKDDSANALEGPRFSLHANGTLEIYSVKEEDDGDYTCVTENSEGKLAITAVLEVKGEI